MKITNMCDFNIDKLPLSMPVVAFSMIILVLFTGCKCISNSNRSLVRLQHPVTGEPLTLLILGGISDDHTYLIQGSHKTLDIPTRVGYLSFKDSFGITYDDSSWVVYHLGDIVDSHQVSKMNLNLRHISKLEYRVIIEKKVPQFMYRYVF